MGYSSLSLPTLFVTHQTHPAIFVGRSNYKKNCSNDVWANTVNSSNTNHSSLPRSAAVTHVSSWMWKGVKRRKSANGMLRVEFRWQPARQSINRTTKQRERRAHVASPILFKAIHWIPLFTNLPPKRQTHIASARRLATLNWGHKSVEGKTESDNRITNDWEAIKTL